MKPDVDAEDRGLGGGVGAEAQRRGALGAAGGEGVEVGSADGAEAAVVGDGGDALGRGDAVMMCWRLLVLWFVICE